MSMALTSRSAPSQAQKEGWQLVGPAQASLTNKSWRGYRLEDFQINLAQRQARCPAGVLSKQCRPYLRQIAQHSLLSF